MNLFRMVGGTGASVGGSTISGSPAPVATALTALLMGGLVTGALAAAAPAARAAEHGQLEDCQAAAKIAYRERVAQGDLMIPEYVCVPDGDGWRVSIRPR